MSSITSYIKNETFYYVKTVDASGASGVSGASGASGTSTFTVTLNQLSLSEVMELFKTGNLTQAEMDKWLTNNKNVKEVKFEETKNVLTYTFKYGNTTYTVSCSTEAAKSQTDKKEQEIYTAYTLKSMGLFKDDIINKYFIVAYSQGSTSQYALKPDCGFNSVAELKLFVNRDSYEKHLQDRIDRLKDKMQTARETMEQYKNGQKDYSEFKNALSILRSTFQGVIGYAQNYGLKDSDKYQNAQKEFQDFIKNTDDQIADMIVNGDINPDDAKKIGKIIENYRATENDNKIQDAIKNLLNQYVKQNNGGKPLSKDDAKAILDFYYPDGIPDEIATQLIEDIEKDSVQQKENIDPSLVDKLTDKTDQSLTLYKEKENLIRQITQYKNRIEYYLQKGDKRSIERLVGGLSNLATALLEFVKNVKNNPDAFNKDGMIADALNQYAKLDDILSKADLTGIDKKYDETMKEIDALAFTDVSTIIDSLFNNKETVTVEELIAAFEAKNGGVVSIESLKDALKQDIEKTYNTAKSDDSRRKALAAREAWLLALISRAEEKYGSYCTIEQLKQELEQEDAAESSKINELINSFNLDNDSELKDACQEIAQNLDIDFSEVKISRETLVNKLKVMFAGRKDITKAEVYNAIKAIYASEAFAIALKNNTEASTPVQETDLSKIIENLKNAMTEEMSTAFANTVIEGTTAQVMDLFIVRCQDIIRALSDVLDAINNGDFDRAEEAITRLQKAIDGLPRMLTTQDDSIKIALEDLTKQTKEAAAKRR